MAEINYLNLPAVYGAAAEMQNMRMNQQTGQIDLLKKQADLANTISQMNERERNQSLKNMELIGNAASGVLGEFERLMGSGVPEAQAIQMVQPIYQQAVQMLIQNGVQVQNPSPVFNPNEARAAAGFVMGVKERVAKAGAPTTTVNVGPEATEEQKALGKFYAEEFSGVQKAGTAARDRIDKVDRIEQLLKDVDTGALTPLRAKLSSYARYFGLDIDPKLGNKQAANALINELALQLRNTGSGNGMPGQMSDKDREFLVSMTPNLALTTEGRQMIMDSAKKLAKRQVEVAKKARAYMQKHGTYKGFQDELDEWVNENPLFGEKDAAAPTGQTTSGQRFEIIGVD